MRSSWLASRSRVLLATITLLAVVVFVTAGPPSVQFLKRTEGPTPAAGQPDADPAFYYSGGKKVHLVDTGLAVVKLKDAKIDDKKLKFQPMALATNSPLAELAPSLRRSGFVVVNTRGPNSLDLFKANTMFPEQVETIMPIVQTALSEGQPGASHLIMTPRITAQFDEKMADEAVGPYVKEFGLKVSRKQEDVPNAYILELTSGPVTYVRVLQAANRLYEQGRNDKRVRYSHPDFIATKKRLQAPTPPDPDFAQQWHLNNTGQGGGTVGADVRALAAWKVTKGRAEIVVAIIDDSVEKDHPDLKPNIKKGRYYNGLTGTVDDDPSPRDGEQRHGTCCAGVAVAASNNFGGCGIAPACGLIGINFWDASVAQTAEAFYFCDRQGAAVISCSWSWQRSDVFDSVSQAVKDLFLRGRAGKGTVILFAAGNESGLINEYQQFGLLKEVICIGASNWKDDHSPYSNHGPELSVVAPSGDRWWVRPDALGILTTDNTEAMPKRPEGFAGYLKGSFTPNLGMQAFGGTSSATPLAAGVCALILSKNPTLSAKQVREILEGTADKIPGVQRPANYNQGHDQFYGHGRLNAEKALNKAAAMPGALP